MNDSNIKVSVVIVTYNCEDVIKQCIESLISQNNIEIIVIDNNSSDDTVTIIKNIKYNFIFLENKINTGFTFACNQGVKKSKGEYIFLLNPDAYITTSSISILLSKIEGNPAIGAVTPQLLYPNGNLQNYNRRFPTISGILIESFIPMKYWNKFSAYRNYVYSDLNLGISQTIEQPAGAALLFRNKFIMDENYFIYGSDVELCKNIYDKGYSIILVPEAKVYHHQSKGGTGSINLKLKAKLQLDYYYAMRYFFNKHYGTFYTYKYITLNVLFLSLVAIASIFTFDLNHIRIKFSRLLLFIRNKNFKTSNI